MKKTNLLFGIVLSIILALGFTSCEEIDPPVPNTSPSLSLLSGSEYVSSDALVEAEVTVKVNLKGTVGTGDLKLLTIFENGNKLDLERIAGGINANPTLLAGSDVSGFEKVVSFQSQLDGANDFKFVLEDINGLKDSVEFTLTIYIPETDLTFFSDTIRIGNLQGPDFGSIDLQKGKAISSSTDPNNDGDVQDIGWTDGTNDWAKRIKPKNGTEMVIPANGVVYSDVITIEKLLEAYEAGTVAQESGDVAVGSIFLFKSPSSVSGKFDYFIMNTLEVNESPGDNNDYYLFILKGQLAE